MLSATDPEASKGARMHAQKETKAVQLRELCRRRRCFSFFSLSLFLSLRFEVANFSRFFTER